MNRILLASLFLFGDPATGGVNVEGWSDRLLECFGAVGVLKEI